MYFFVFIVFTKESIIRAIDFPFRLFTCIVVLFYFWFIVLGFDDPKEQGKETILAQIFSIVETSDNVYAPCSRSFFAVYSLYFILKIAPKANSK